MKKCLPVLIPAALLSLMPLLSHAAESDEVYGTLGPINVLGSGPHRLEAGAGIFGFYNDIDKRSFYSRLEFRAGRKAAFVGPAAGLIANSEGGRYGYAGIYADFAYDKLVVTPVLAVGIYRRGNSVDLGGPYQFRESIEFAYPIAGRWRAGISLAHISNAGIYRENPGQIDFSVSCGIGF